MTKEQKYRIVVTYSNARQGMMGWKTKIMNWQDVNSFRDSFNHCCNNKRSYVVLEDDNGYTHYLSWKLVLNMEFRTYEV